MIKSEPDPKTHFEKEEPLVVFICLEQIQKWSIVVLEQKYLEYKRRYLTYNKHWWNASLRNFAGVGSSVFEGWSHQPRQHWQDVQSVSSQCTQ